jgi:hypothetical protein
MTLRVDGPEVTWFVRMASGWEVLSNLSRWGQAAAQEEPEEDEKEEEKEAAVEEEAAAAAEEAAAAPAKEQVEGAAEPSAAAAVAGNGAEQEAPPAAAAEADAPEVAVGEPAIESQAKAVGEAKAEPEKKEKKLNETLLLAFRYFDKTGERQPPAECALLLLLVTGATGHGKGSVHSALELRLPSVVCVDMGCTRTEVRAAQSVPLRSRRHRVHPR